MLCLCIDMTPIKNQYGQSILGPLKSILLIVINISLLWEERREEPCSCARLRFSLSAVSFIKRAGGWAKNVRIQLSKCEDVRIGSGGSPHVSGSSCAASFCYCL